MKKLTAILILMGLPCFADELILKDGRRLSWKTVTDEGESYAIETRDGKKLKIKKTEVDHFGVPGDGPIEGPLTGAAVVDTKKAATAGAPVDILLKGKVGGDTGWKYGGRILAGEGQWPIRSIVVFSHDVPEEYDLALTVERADDGKKDFDVGIVTPAGTCAYHFDAWDAAKSCLALLGGQEGEYAAGQVFRKGKPRAVKMMVRKDGLTVQLDGRDWWKGKVDWSQASLHPAVKVSEKGKLFLAAAGGAWRVTSMTIAPVVAR